VIAPRRVDWENAIKPDEIRDMTDDIKRWPDMAAARGKKWRTAPGSLEDATVNGKPVVHSCFTGRARPTRPPVAELLV
jgi:hypothetical protein